MVNKWYETSQRHVYLNFYLSIIKIGLISIPMTTWRNDNLVIQDCKYIFFDFENL